MQYSTMIFEFVETHFTYCACIILKSDLTTMLGQREKPNFTRVGKLVNQSTACCYSMVHPQCTGVRSLSLYLHTCVKMTINKFSTRSYKIAAYKWNVRIKQKAVIIKIINRSMKVALQIKEVQTCLPSFKYVRG